jgi:putative transposase
MSTRNVNAIFPAFYSKKALKPSAKRKMIEQLVQTRLSIMRACQIVGLSRAAYYKRPALA